MNNNYENLYVGDLSKFADQFKAVAWTGTTSAQRNWPNGIPGQASIVASMTGTPFKVKGTGFLVQYAGSIGRHRELLKRRGRNRLSTEPLAKFALAAEHLPPTGQAYGWFREVIHYVPLSGIHVAKQIARLAGEDCEVTIPWRSLAEAVGRADRLNRTRAYTERGVQALVEGGWLSVKTTGSKRGAKTTFSLEVGDRGPEARRMAANIFEDRDLLTGDGPLEETG